MQQPEVNCGLPWFARLRRFFDVRPGEGLPVLLSFLYIGVVVAAFLLAKPIRNGLFLGPYGAYALVYVYAAVPLVLSLFVPVYTRVAARFGARPVTIATLLFFSLNVLLFWYLVQRSMPIPAPAGRLLCLGELLRRHRAGAGVELRQLALRYPPGEAAVRPDRRRRVAGRHRRRAAGPLAGRAGRRHDQPAAGPGAPHPLAAAIVVRSRTCASGGSDSRGAAGRSRAPFAETVAGRSLDSPYLRLMAALVFLAAIATQWTALQLGSSPATLQRRADGPYRFFGTFNFAPGTVSFLVQLLLTGPALRTFGRGGDDPGAAAGAGSGGGAHRAGAGVLERAADQRLRSGPPVLGRQGRPTSCSTCRSRRADATADQERHRHRRHPGGGCGRAPCCSASLTVGFFMLPGLGSRTCAARPPSTSCSSASGSAVAWRLRAEYVRTIQDSIHRHRIDTERATSAVLERSAADALRDKLAAARSCRRCATRSICSRGSRRASWHPALRALLTHPEADIRQRALALLSAGGDREIAAGVPAMLRDPDLGVRTEALLYLSRELGIDPLRADRGARRLRRLLDPRRDGGFPRLARTGAESRCRAADLDGDGARAGRDGRRDRAEAARLIALVPAAFVDLLPALLADSDLDVARQAIRAAPWSCVREELIDALIGPSAGPSSPTMPPRRSRGSGTPSFRSSRAAIATTCPLEVRRELPSVLVRIGTVEAEQVLIGSMLHADPTLRHRVIASLNKLRTVHPEFASIRQSSSSCWRRRSSATTARIRCSARLQERLGRRSGARGDGHSMEQELERIFR